MNLIVFFFFCDSFQSRHNKEGNGNKEVTFRDFEGGEIREVTLWVDPDRKTKLGRRALLSEAYLGITPGTFSDRVRVMVAGFIHDGEAMKSKNIKIGDWLRSINSIEVTFENLENVLSDISSSMAVSHISYLLDIEKQNTLCENGSLTCNA